MIKLIISVLALAWLIGVVALIDHAFRTMHPMAVIGMMLLGVWVIFMAFVCAKEDESRYGKD